MVSRTRRRVVGLAAALLTGTAGCSDRTGQNPPTTTAEPTQVTDYETHHLRTDDPERFIESSREDERERDRAFVVATQETLDSLRYRRRPDGLAEFDSFLSATDFSTESLFVAQLSPGECYRTRIDYVSRQDGEFHVEFCRVYRDASVTCQTGESDLQVVAIRFPFPLEKSTGYSYGGGRTCSGPPWNRSGED